MTVKERLSAIRQIQADAQAMIKALQEECLHPLYTAKYGGNTGNWSESDDSYWIDLHCPECHWSMTAFHGCEKTGMFYHGNHPRVIK